MLNCPGQHYYLLCTSHIRNTWYFRHFDQAILHWLLRYREDMFTFTFVVVEKVGRRKGLIWGAALGCIPMWYIGGYVMKADPAGAALRGDISRDGWGYLAMVCVYVNAFIICATWQGITWTYASEIFPLDIRMLCVSLTTADTWLGSFIIARSTPYMISDLGYGAYFFFATILLMMGVWSFQNFMC